MLPVVRSAFTIGLLHYLHLFRKAPEGFEQAYEKYREAYETIEKFFDENGDNLFKEYEQSSKIPSSIAIEIRKDYVWRFSSAGEALPVRGLSGVLSQNVNAVAKPIAQAIIDHCQLDYRRRK